MIGVVSYIRCTGRKDSAKARRCSAAVREWAGKNGAEVRKEFREYSSGTSGFCDRPALSSAIVALSVCGCDKIVVPDISAIGRTEEAVADNLNACIRGKAKVYLIREGLEVGFDTRTDASEKVIELARAEEQKMEKTLRSLRRGRAKAVRSGVHIGRKPGAVKTDLQLAEEYRDVLELLRQGTSIRKTAALAGVSASTVQRMKNKFINSKDGNERDKMPVKDR